MPLPFDIPCTTPILIAGPTASGKSQLALEYACAQGRSIINADALQIYSNWPILSAQPSLDDLSAAPHFLYGHIKPDTPYSVGHWLRELSVFEGNHPAPIIIGGTGLYFRALTEGLANIPAIKDHIRDEANTIILHEGDHSRLLADLITQDPQTAANIDQRNPMRVQRAWEVLKSTGKGLYAWQQETPAPLLPLSKCFPILIEADPNWLLKRIETRFDLMLSAGALEEARANLAQWDPLLPSSKTIGAPELISHLQGAITLEEAILNATISTRQYAKRQRTWFRNRMKAYHKLTKG